MVEKYVIIYKWVCAVLQMHFLEDFLKGRINHVITEYDQDRAFRIQR